MQRLRLGFLSRAMLICRDWAPTTTLLLTSRVSTKLVIPGKMVGLVIIANLCFGQIIQFQIQILIYTKSTCGSLLSKLTQNNHQNYMVTLIIHSQRVLIRKWLVVAGFLQEVPQWPNDQVGSKSTSKKQTEMNLGTKQESSDSTGMTEENLSVSTLILHCQWLTMELIIILNKLAVRNHSKMLGGCLWWKRLSQNSIPITTISKVVSRLNHSECSQTSQFSILTIEMKKETSRHHGKNSIFWLQERTHQWLVAVGKHHLEIFLVVMHTLFSVQLRYQIMGRNLNWSK